MSKGVMRFLADENCDFRVNRALRAADHAVTGVVERGQSLRRRAEIFSQEFRVWGRLILLNGHEIPFAVGEIQFATERHPMIVLGAGILLINRIEVTPIKS